MAINNKTWTVDEEITSDALNGMVDDANNSTDNIHPQYDSLYDYIGKYIKVINDTTVGYVRTGDILENPSYEILSSNFPGQANLVVAHRVRFKKNSLSNDTLVMKFKLIKVENSSSSNAFTAWVVAYENDTRIYGDPASQYSITTVEQAISVTKDISAVAEGSLITVDLILRLDTYAKPTNHAEYEMAKMYEIEIYTE